MVVIPHIHKGFPPLLGIQTWQGKCPQGRQPLSRRGFLKARPACGEAPETLRAVWVFGSGETSSVQARLRCTECGCFPRARHRMRGKWVFGSGEIGLARKTDIPRTKGFNVIIIGLLLYMNGLYMKVLTRRGCSSGYECNIETLLYMIGLSANSQEALSRALGAE